MFVNPILIGPIFIVLQGASYGTNYSICTVLTIKLQIAVQGLSLWNYDSAIDVLVFKICSSW
jgi:hypothetical protein